MKHIILFYYLVSFITGCVSIGISGLIRSRYRKPVVLRFILFLSSIALILFSLALNLYFELSGLTGNRTAAFVSHVIDLAGTALFTAGAPGLFHELAGIPISKGFAFIPPVLGSVFLVIIPFGDPSTFPPAVSVPLMTILYGTFAYIVLLPLIFRNRIGNPYLRRALMTSVFVSACFFPVILFEGFRPGIPGLARYDFLELFSLPSFFLVLNVLSIVFAVRYFNQPPFFAGDTLTPHFLTVFGITGRESEIVRLIMEGRSNREIAETLFIAYKTVDNHIQSIYRKTGVKNRVQLLNLIRTNRT